MPVQQTSTNKNWVEKLMSAETIVKLTIYIIAAAVGYANMSNKIDTHTVILQEMKDDRRQEIDMINRLKETVVELKIDITALKQKQQDDDTNNK